jgi:hypothetical protein
MSDIQSLHFGLLIRKKALTGPYINDDGYELPDNTIALIPFNRDKQDKFLDIVEPLKDNPKRDWFTPHFYYCLPLVIGNQYGFSIRSLHSFTAVWDGTDSDPVLTFDDIPDFSRQTVKSGFGNGIITIQNGFYFKTPVGVNIMTFQPPNIFIPGMSVMAGVIETDNIKRDFTFNIKVNVPNFEIKVKRGDIIAAFIPIPRYFVDNFSIENGYSLISETIVNNELDEGTRLSNERISVDKEKAHQSGRRYFSGINTDGTKYSDHQKKVL